MVLLLLACSGDTLLTSSSPLPAGTAAQDDPAPVDTAAEALPGSDDPVGTEEDAGSQDALDDAWIFDNTYVHELHIRLDDAAWEAIEADAHAFVSGDVEYDGYEVEDVGVHIRGKIGSYRLIEGKPKWKIDFAEYRDGQELFGLHTLLFNNEVVDCSGLKEPLGYAVFRAAGIKAPRTAFARVYVNDLDYGLYTVLESPDADFLAKNWADGTGNLYDGKYLWYGGGSYSLIDFTPSQDYLFQLEEGTDVAFKDIRAVTHSVQTSTGSGNYEDGTDVVDWDQFHTYLAVEQWIGHDDGYALNTNNYRVYFNPEDGRAQWVPYDLDYAFLNDYDWGMSWWSPRGAVVAGCWSDADCIAAQKEAMRTLVDTLDVDALMAEFDGWSALVREDQMNDPRAECWNGYLDYYQEYLRTWSRGRSDTMRSTWGL